jgi:hypothetical protein
MLQEIGTVENIPAFIEQVKQKKRRVMGLGHRVYKVAGKTMCLSRIFPLWKVALLNLYIFYKPRSTGKYFKRNCR